MTGEFAIIGMGQFGMALALHLAREGQSVLAIDRDFHRIETIKDEVDAAVSADATDEDALYGLRLESMSCVVVAMGIHSVEASILTTALLRQMGVPRIIARGTNRLHSRVLHSVGAHEVVDPEEEMGRRLALRLAQPSIVDQIQLGNANLAEVEAPNSFIGKTLVALDVRNQYRVSILAIRRGDDVNANPRADDQIEEGDILVVLGRPEAINRLAALA